MTTTAPLRRAVVVADGDVPPAEDVARELLAADGDTLVIAADGGLRKAQLLGLQPRLVVGDGDSLGPDTLAALPSRGVDVQIHPTAKEASDTELALREAIARGAREIVILGALGGVRFDHSLANVLLLGLPELDGLDVALVDGRTTVRVLGAGGSLELAGQPGDTLSLLPLSEVVTGVRTTGLRYPLNNDSLTQGPTLGLSNEMTGEHATVAVASGRLAVILSRLLADAPSASPDEDTDR